MLVVTVNDSLGSSFSFDDLSDLEEGSLDGDACVTAFVDAHGPSAFGEPSAVNAPRKPVRQSSSKELNCRTEALATRRSISASIFHVLPGEKGWMVSQRLEEAPRLPRRSSTKGEKR